MAGHDTSPTPPREAVSLVATIFNEADTIASWLRSIGRQTRLPDEIVIVDAGSTDGTAEIAASADIGIPVRVVVVAGANIPQGRNIAFEHATGPIVAVTDAGTLLEPDWLARLVAPLEADPAAAVSAGFFRPHGETWFEWVLGTIITPRWPEIDPARFLPSSRSLAVRREWWQRAGGYPGWLRACEDLVFDLRLKDAGARFVMAPDAVVRWRARSTLRGFFEQYRGYARGDGHAHLWPKRHALRFGAYTAAPLLLVAGVRRRLAWAMLAAGFAGYIHKPWSRLAAERPFESGASTAAAYALAPVIVVVGDIAKLVGYPQGLWERRRAGDPEALEHAPSRLRSRSTTLGRRFFRHQRRRPTNHGQDHRH
jgi:glycosyltransferase involved in cell wall biosynthesis